MSRLVTFLTATVLYIGNACAGNEVPNLVMDSVDHPTVVIEQYKQRAKEDGAVLQSNTQAFLKIEKMSLTMAQASLSYKGINVGFSAVNEYMGIAAYEAVKESMKVDSLRNMPAKQQIVAGQGI